jgi:glutathione-regulated potassium-efflux system ancillary protein KefC
MYIDPFYADALWLAIAFVCGLAAKRLGLPPLVGFLVGGFIINFSGLRQGQLVSAIEPMAHIGVMLLLFTIGLKLKLKSLFRKEIWASASIHMVLVVLLFSGLLMFLSYLGLSQLTDMTWTSAAMISFALSFSSTVFVVKTLESRGEFDSYHGKLAIGILIIQDIFAVLFIAFSDKKLPSPWVFLLPLFLWLLQKVLSRILNILEHGEMIPVFGFFATFIAGALSFSLVGLKPDLGALIIGMMLVNHPRSDELYKRMVEYKDFFLIAFFLNVGLVGLPSVDILVLTAVLLPLVLVKGSLYLFILSKFDLQPRTSYLGALSLTNFSEFGLIVGVVGVSIGVMSNDWLVVMALLMSLSFVAASPLNKYSHVIFDKFKAVILRLNKNRNTIDCEPNDLCGAEYLVIGLGSVGIHTFDTLRQNKGELVLGLDYDDDLIIKLRYLEKNVLWADSTDSEFWDNIDTSGLKMVYLTMSDVQTNLNILECISKIKVRNFKVCAICHYPDEKEKYEDHGADFVYQFKNYIGQDYVEQSMSLLPN